MRFSSQMFPNKATFYTGAYAVGVHGAPAPTYAAGASIDCYVETYINASTESENPFQKATARTRYRIFSQTDPNAALSRPLQPLDHAIQTDGPTPVVVVVTKGSVFQDPLWLVEGEGIV